MRYKIKRTDTADEQLRDIIFYIADTSGSVDIALKYLDKLEMAIDRLAEFPRSGNRPRYSILCNQGYLVLIVEKHLIFYKIDDIKKEVIIYAVVDGRREYLNIIL